MNPWDKLKHYFNECVAIPPQRGNVVGGDMAGRDMVKQTIVGNGNVQSMSNVQMSGAGGVSIVQRNGHIEITGPVKTLVLNGKVVKGLGDETSNTG